MKLRTPLAVTLVAALVVVAALLADRYMRLGRDLIFYSSDVAEFVLPNGKVVRTNRWYDQIDLLAEGQEFYTASNGLGIMRPNVDGFAMATDHGDRRSYLKVTKTSTTTLDMNLAAAPVGQEAVRAGVFDEYWIRRQGAEATR